MELSLLGYSCFDRVAFQQLEEGDGFLVANQWWSGLKLDPRVELNLGTMAVPMVKPPSYL